ncbi:type IV toxin-antitoxin system AbiEi family antitoxin domain-containing protein [Oerskovia turbata]
MVSQRAVVAGIAGDQWGLITTAQAERHGINRMQLSRWTKHGELERVIQGVYAIPAATGQWLLHRALWLSLDPVATAWERMRDHTTCGAFSHATAAAILNIGDILDHKVEITVPSNRRTRHTDLRIHVAPLDRNELTIAEAMPVTTVERTLRDLEAAGNDLDHVTNARRDAQHLGHI